MKKNDWILFAAVLLIGGTIWGYQMFRPVSEDGIVQVQVQGSLYGSYELSEEQEIEIGGTNQLKIEDGYAKMIEADCPDQLCVHQKAISKDGESIICLPNEVVVTVQGGEENELDAITN